jgi:hypothetical protein
MRGAANCCSKGRRRQLDMHANFMHAKILNSSAILDALFTLITHMSVLGLIYLSCKQEFCLQGFCKQHKLGIAFQEKNKI